MAVAPERMSLEEFLLLPEDEPALEFEDGVVSQKMSPTGHHGAVQFGLAKRIDAAYFPQKVARVFTETRITLAGVSRVPDVCVYRWDRIPLDAPGKLARDFREPPDITIEVVSPSQSVNELVRKCVWYVEHGVEIALLVDPSDQSILAFRKHSGVTVWRGLDRVNLDPVLPALDLSVDEVFEALQQG